jgi:RHS repeat-associated protein
VTVYHTDGLGSVRALTDNTGSVVQTYQTDEFGVPLASGTQGSNSQPFAFTGEERDPEDGFVNLHARLYDPLTGRLIQADPVRKTGFGISGWNRFAYTLNSPVTVTDQSGLCSSAACDQQAASIISPCLFQDASGRCITLTDLIQVALGLSQFVEVYPNREPNSLQQDLADAQRLGVKPLKVGEPGFDEVVNQGTVKWSVDVRGELRVIPKYVNGVELKHSVITGGEPVIAAGEAEISALNGEYYLSDINAQSGHYFNPESNFTNQSLNIGRQAFESAGVHILPQ